MIMLTEKVKMVQEILYSILQLPNPIKEDEDLIMLGMDSLKSINLILGLEEKFGIIIPDDELMIDNFSTIQKILFQIEKNENNQV